MGGAITVAVRVFALTQACPVLGTPSTPMNGMFIHRPLPSPSRENSWKAFFAPAAIASFCAAIKSIWACCEVLRRSQDVTALEALASVQFPLIVLIWMDSGLTSYMPAVRSLHASVSEGP